MGDPPPDQLASHPRVGVERIRDAGSYTRVTHVDGVGDLRFVLVPGIGMGVGIFERLAPRLLPHGSVHALDLPGFAGIRLHDDPLDIDEYADLVIRALEVCGLRDVVLIGHSMGSQVVTSAACRGANLRGVVLISPVVAPWQRRFVTVAIDFVRSSMHEPPGVALLAVISYAFTGLRSFFRTMPRMLAYRTEDRIVGATAPVLIVRGTRDRVCPSEWTAMLRDRTRDAQVVEVVGAAHSVMHQHATSVADRIISFAGVASPSPLIDRPRWTVRLRAHAVIARAREMVAIIRGDDRALARAKTSRIRAALAAGEAG